jgi:hypothetical protein
MSSIGFRLLALVAVLLLPLAMAAAPAAAGASQHATAMPTNDHERHHSGGLTHDRLAQCAMPCSAALPAADLPPIPVHAAVRAAPEPFLASPLSGIELEIATPPPRFP